jgi:ADP-heptose:LPS heptosyltransferase
MNTALAPNLLARLPKPPRKVVLLRASRIGDFLCAMPALRALRARLPEVEISMITLPLLQEIAERSPSIDRFFPFPGFPGLAEQLFDPHAAVDFLRQVQQEAFDLAIQMQGTGVHSNPFTLLLGARASAGFIRPGDPPGLLDAALPYPHELHEIRCVLALTTFLGAPPQGEELEFPLWPEDQTAAERLLSDLPQPWIGLHPSSRDGRRRWPLEDFAALGRHLQERYGGTLLLLGDSEAHEAGQALEQVFLGTCRNLIGKTSLPVLGAVIARLALLVTNDSGPAHIAYALCTPTVTIFGSSASPASNGPLIPGPFRLLVAHNADEPTLESQVSETITEARVFAAATELLSQ